MDPVNAQKISPRRILILGASGAGKTTFARKLSEGLDLPHVELDSLYWGPNWTPVNRKVFLDRVATVVEGERWIAEGDYDLGVDLLRSRSEQIVWIDRSLPVTLVQVFWRTFTRALTREPTWGGNSETLRSLLLSRGSILIWAWRSHRMRRKQYPGIPGILRLRSRRDLRNQLGRFRNDVIF